MVGFDRIIGLCRPGERGGEESVQTWKGGGGGWGQFSKSFVYQELLKF